jgi:hypothetical protein
MKIPRHIVWSTDRAEDIDLNDPENRRWWVKQVLMNGRMEDILSLDLNEVEKILPELYLPRPIKKLWSDYFAKRRSANQSVDSCDSASFPVFLDGVSSANPSGFDESTAPAENLARIQRNWIVSPSKVNNRTNSSAEPGDGRPIQAQGSSGDSACEKPVR